MTTRRSLFQAVLASCAAWVGLPVAAAQPANSLAVALAQNFRPGTDPRAYLVSEKLDGVRALWSGQQLQFRSGQTIEAPAWFIKQLPANTRLDGELWLGRGRFDALSGTVRKRIPIDEEWRALSYWVFELPQGSGPFEARYAALQALVQSINWPGLRVVPQERLPSVPALMAKLRQVVSGGGEGLVLHEASAPYTPGRNAHLLKLKPVQDAEATVIAHLPGQGKFKGKVGALHMRGDDGVAFKLGSGLTDAQRAAPPALGTRVTYSYTELTPKGKPRFPRFVRVRDLP